MKCSILILFFSVVSAFAVQAQEFSVTGTKIYDTSGKEFIIKGANMFEWQGTSDFELMSDCWKFNAIRVPVFLLVKGDPNLQNPKLEDYAGVKGIVNKFTGAGIVVIFDAHDRIGGYYNDSDYVTLTTYWRDMATLFKNNPYVWFDLHNEPEGMTTDFTKWTQYHRGLVSFIRDTMGAENIILIEGASWGQDAGDNLSGMVVESGSALLSAGHDILSFNSKTYSNIVFSFHIYEQWNGSLLRLTDYVKRLQEKNLCVVIGEFGSGSSWTATQHMYTMLETYNIGRLVWVWMANDNHDLTTEGFGSGSGINSCTAPTTLTLLGLKVWSDIHPGFTLTVTGGSGSGSYFEGAKVNVTAAKAPTGKRFDTWTGDVKYLADSTDSISKVTMPTKDISIMATYRDIVNSFTTNNLSIDIYPNPATDVIKISSCSEIEKLEITGISGVTLKRLPNIRSKTASVDISNIHESVLIISVVMTDGTLIKKQINRIGGN